MAGRNRGLPVPIARITLVGAKGVGKTRLVDSYVNAPPPNTPWAIPSTESRELYHKLVTLPADETSVLTEFQKSKRVLVELEDTPPSTLLTLNHILNDAQGANEDALRHPMAKILSLSRPPSLMLPQGVTDLTPFGIFSYPREFTEAGVMNAKPITRGRMGFALCFSLLDMNSLTEAERILQLSKLVREYEHELLTPLMFLIGTHDDEVGKTESRTEQQEIQRTAEAIAQRERIPLFMVSTKSGRNVDRVLNELVAQIVQTPSLSAYDIVEMGDEDQDENEESELSE
eukprot:Protomagalhaensia_wolfi_Nauph_80__1935@NODE_2213_length_1167_cov_13_148050_g1727_i0_p1_GENE_NODE_2213_length_1167_cov_13_148050_g1727_i0NODE_2213_length_1167_cov_13_148050_g1727_i0_p1_ORF_typecomplete_len287_score60_40Ras/PF00071_22/0_091Ras/PF00071_22/5_1e08TniB/PF05621_11/0_086TniB/PF05621_11/4_1Roc/PF08477_13/0_09Roc/PF08477_13/1_1e03Roc/PF08477_13/1_6e02AAA_22/PF13401_6/0_095AAA_22/PF13401_6/4e02NTPase_1/PF03266_15/4_5NTPase_1/PF03266_15/23NBARC/PF00931_22/0_12NBARC/PF00931_22/2_2e03AAA_16/P